MTKNSVKQKLLHNIKTRKQLLETRLKGHLNAEIDEYERSEKEMYISMYEGMIEKLEKQLQEEQEEDYTVGSYCNVGFCDERRDMTFKDGERVVKSLHTGDGVMIGKQHIDHIDEHEGCVMIHLKGTDHEPENPIWSCRKRFKIGDKVRVLVNEHDVFVFNHFEKKEYLISKESDRNGCDWVLDNNGHIPEKYLEKVR